jgi:tetratricopeptide (TPR) repeat protein
MCRLDDLGAAGLHAYQTMWICYHRSETDKAEQWANQCAEAWARVGSKYYQAQGMFGRGMVAQLKGDYPSAELLYKDALAIYRDLNMDGKIESALYVLGGLEYERNDYDKAEQYYREALLLIEKVESKDGLTAVYGGFGSIAIQRERWEEAREWFEKELPLAREIGRQDLIAVAQYGRARVYEAEGQPDLALPMALEALAINDNLQNMYLPLTQKLVERLKKKLEEK